MSDDQNKSMLAGITWLAAIVIVIIILVGVAA